MDTALIPPDFPAELRATLHRPSVIRSCAAWLASDDARMMTGRSFVACEWNKEFNGYHNAAHVADEMGWFADEGITIDIREGQGSTATAQTVAAGETDFGMVGDGLAFAEHSQTDWENSLILARDFLGVDPAPALEDLYTNEFLPTAEEIASG